MQLSKILLDLDDVLNAFTMSALAKVGCPVGSFEFSAYNPRWGFDIISAANALHKTESFDNCTFWESLDYDFWATLPKSNEMEFLLEKCESIVGRENVHVVTAPTWQTYVSAAKVDWIQHNLQKEHWLQFVITKCKYLCAKEDVLLIDDNDSNIDSFIKHGGKAMTMPRPWNHLWAMTNEHGMSDFVFDTLLNLALNDW